MIFSGVDRIKFFEVSGKEILSIDYSGCKTDEMIELFDQAKAEVIRLAKTDYLILTNFAGTFITPAYLRYVEREMPQLKHLIKKNAFINMSFPQRMILKGFALFIGKDDFVAFDSYDEAINYLLADDQ